MYWSQLIILLTLTAKMKKRAQVPDAQTYTIIFNGASKHPAASDALGRVISIYQSMLTDRCPVKPNTIHVNAIIKMCARAGNMDAMLAIADELPPRGLRAPNNLTYTTIINALRMYAVNDLGGTLTPEQKEVARQKTMLDVRRLWQEVITSWRKGDMWIDEELVCAMGRALLIGKAQDLDDIMSLVEQAMNIPRQAPRMVIRPKKLIASRAQENADVGEDGGQEPKLAQTGSDTVTDSHDPSSSGVQSPETTPIETGSEMSAFDNNDPVVDQFQSLTLTDSSRSPVNAYAKPGPNTLSLLMQCLLDLRSKEPAIKYWDLLTKQYGIRPDAENYHAYLRILRVARASSDTVKVLTEMPQHYMQTKTFRIAMSTCLRDKNNQHVFSNSGKVLDMMQQTQEAPDLKTLQTYLDLAMIAPLSSKMVSAHGAKLTQGRQIIRALERLGPSVVNLRSLLVHGDTSGARSEPQEKTVQDTLILIRKMISAHDILIDRDLVPSPKLPELAAQRSKLASFITRVKHSKKGGAAQAVRMAPDARPNKPIEKEERDERVSDKDE